MKRYKVTGHDCNLRTMTVYVTAADRDGAVDAAFDDMGLMAVWSVRQTQVLG